MTQTAAVPPTATIEDPSLDQSLTAQHEARKPLTPAAERALAEAAARRAEVDRRAAVAAGEQNGPRGPEPIRFGDWEVKGRASDF